MSYRDDHEAAIMRADAAERETARLADDNRGLRVELDAATQWLGGPRRRVLVIAIIIVIAAASGIGGVVLGRTTASCPTCPVVSESAAMPSLEGLIVGDGPTVGHWTLLASMCASHSDGIELSAVGSEDHVIWLSEHSVEIEVPNGDFFLEASRCAERFDFGLIKHDGLYSGHVSLDCSWFDPGPDGHRNRLQGRIDFTRCR